MYSQDPRPHASIAWLLGDQEEKVQAYIDSIAAVHSKRGLAGREVIWSQQVVPPFI